MLKSEEGMTETQLIEYFEHVRYQVAGFKKGDFFTLPTFSGSGFLLSHKGYTVFVTAGHVASTFNNCVIVYDRDITIQTNTIIKNPFTHLAEGCILVSLSGLTTTSVFKVDTNTGSLSTEKPFEVAVKVLDEERKNAPFVTQEVNFLGAHVPYGEPKMALSSNDIVVANSSDTYSVYGRIKLFFEKNSNVLQSTIVFHTGLRLLYETDDMYVLQYGSPVLLSEWKGLSGSPVLNQDGKLIGMACSVDPFTNTLSVMKMIRIVPLIEADIQSSQI